MALTPSREEPERCARQGSSRRRAGGRLAANPRSPIGVLRPGGSFLSELRGTASQELDHEHHTHRHPQTRLGPSATLWRMTMETEMVELTESVGRPVAASLGVTGRRGPLIGVAALLATVTNAVSF